MEIGERIQKIRKEQEMSQEELAKKLLISRQTISQWETGQTVPSLDNIYRLKEIFNISFDDLMNESINESDFEKPIEEYTVIQNEKITDFVFGIAFAKEKNRALTLGIISAVVFINTIFMMTTPSVTVLLPLFIFCLVIFIKATVDVSKLKKSFLSSLISTTQYFKIFNDNITISFNTNDGSSATYNVRLSTASLIRQTSDFVVLNYGKNVFAIPKQILDYNSLLLKNQLSAPLPTKKERALSLALLIASPMSFVFGIIFVLNIGMMLDTSLNFTDYFWILFLFTPIPIASIIVGIISNNKKIKNRKNIVIGVVFLSLLCIFGSFTFIFHQEYYTDYRYVNNLESQTGIDFPDEGEISMIDYEHDESVNSIYDTESTITFAPKDTEDFKKAIYDNQLWLTEITSELEGCCPYSTMTNKFDRFVIYNEDTKEFNSLPNESGEFSFIIFGFDNDKLEIYEYKKSITVTNNQSN